MRDRVTVRRAGRRARRRLPKIVDGFGPNLAAQCVMCELVDLFGETILVQALDRLDDPRMQRAPRLREESSIRDLVGQGVLEGVLGLRPGARLVEKLGALETLEGPLERVFRQPRYGLDHGERHVLADDRRDLEQAPFLRCEYVAPTTKN